MWIILIALLANTAGATGPLADIEKQCLKSYKKNKHNICFCVTMNLSARFKGQRIEALSKIYKNKTSRWTASRDPRNKAMLDFDYEVHKNCSRDANWKWIPDDLGEPDPL